MAIKFSDLIENINSNYPVVDAGGDHVKGIIFANLGEPLSSDNILLIPATKRGVNSIVIDKAQETIYIYKGFNVSNETWGNVDNWVKVSGGGGGTSLGDDDSYTTELLQDNNAAIGDFNLDTTYTYAIDKLNELMGKIVPTAPSALISLPLDEVTNTSSSGVYENIYTNSNYNTSNRLEYAVLRATTNGIPSAYGGDSVASNTVVRWLKSTTTSLYVKFTGLTNIAANPNDTFEVYANGVAIPNTFVELPEVIDNGSTYSNPSVSANNVTTSSTGFPTSGSGAGFYTTYNTIQFSLGISNSIFTEDQYNLLEIWYNGASVCEAYFYMTTVSDNPAISHSVQSQSVPSLSPNNYDNGIRFVRDEDMNTAATRFSASINFSNISGHNAYGVNDYSTSSNTYGKGTSNGVLVASGTASYPSSVGATASGSLTAYYYPVDNEMGIFDLDSSDHRPKGNRYSVFGGTAGFDIPAGNIRDYSLLVYPTDSIPSDAFWSGRTIVDNSISSSYEPSVGGAVSSASRVKDPGAGSLAASFVDTPANMLSSDLYDGRYASGNINDGVLIHKSDAIVAFGKAMNLSQAQLALYLDGNSNVPNQQLYNVEARDTTQYVTMGLTINQPVSNLNLTLTAPTGIAAAWVFMDDDGDWESYNSPNNGWVTLNQTWPGGTVPGLFNDQGAQGASVPAMPSGSTAINNQTYTITSGTANFVSGVSGTSGHNVFLRFKLNAGQTITKFVITS